MVWQYDNKLKLSKVPELGIRIALQYGILASWPSFKPTESCGEMPACTVSFKHIAHMHFNIFERISAGLIPAPYGDGKSQSTAITHDNLQHWSKWF